MAGSRLVTRRAARPFLILSKIHESPRGYSNSTRVNRLQRELFPSLFIGERKLFASEPREIWSNSGGRKPRWCLLRRKTGLEASNHRPAEDRNPFRSNLGESCTSCNLSSRSWPAPSIFFADFARPTPPPRPRFTIEISPRGFSSENGLRRVRKAISGETLIARSTCTPRKWHSPTDVSFSQRCRTF